MISREQWVNEMNFESLDMLALMKIEHAGLVTDERQVKVDDGNLIITMRRKTVAHEPIVNLIIEKHEIAESSHDELMELLDTRFHNAEITLKCAVALGGRSSEPDIDDIKRAMGE